MNNIQLVFKNTFWFEESIFCLQFVVRHKNNWKMSSSEELQDFALDLDDIEVEEESLVQIRKQLLLTQQFRVDQERKNATISSLKRRIESLEDEKSTSYVEIGHLRTKIRDKENVESILSSITIDLEEANDKYTCSQLENENLIQEMKSLQSR